MGDVPVCSLSLLFNQVNGSCSEAHLGCRQQLCLAYCFGHENVPLNCCQLALVLNTDTKQWRKTYQWCYWLGFLGAPLNNFLSSLDTKGLLNIFCSGLIACMWGQNIWCMVWCSNLAHHSWDLYLFWHFVLVLQHVWSLARQHRYPGKILHDFI